MTDVFIASDNIISPLGTTSSENFAQLAAGRSAVSLQENEKLSPLPFYASLFNNDSYTSPASACFTKFEQLLIESVKGALDTVAIKPADKDTILIISSTKGNISLLEDESVSPQLKSRIALHTSAKMVAEHLGFINKPVVVSNACISGLLALITGMRLLQSGQYKNAVITGADVISKFVLSGFQSFQAISHAPCKPFDEARNGINLGEGAGTIILSSNRAYEKEISIRGGSVSNDANHISGPSRTGEELYAAIGKAMTDARISASEVDFISAHGTATVYNDAMEAKAITLAGMNSVPLNSLKGYYGHTLGAAGLIEAVISIHSLKSNIVLPTHGFISQGSDNPLNVCKELLSGDLKNCLKTASGFGGCNAAIVLGKN
ncbi:MAG: beta-ketoacyl synthase [Chitinophagaceae bacterium]|nr:beta-ketoacyl synthase [Chitinophagaceae bacterium]